MRISAKLNDLNIAINKLENEVSKFWLQGKEIEKRKVLEGQHFLEKRKWFLINEYGLDEAVKEKIFPKELAIKLRAFVTE